MRVTEVNKNKKLKPDQVLVNEQDIYGIRLVRNWIIPSFVGSLFFKEKATKEKNKKQKQSRQQGIAAQTLSHKNMISFYL